MSYYEYTPNDRRTAEKVLVCLAVTFAAACLGVSWLDGVLYAAFLQFAAVVFLTIAFTIANRSLLRGYTYTVTEPQENGERDFLVTEHYGKKHTAVCRVSLSQVTEAKILSMREKRVTGKAADRANLIYNYFSALFPRELLFVTLQTGDAVTLLKISADQGLENALNSLNRNKCL